MTPNTKKERFSLAYISAVAAHAGYQVMEPQVDFDSVDGQIMSDFGRRPRIDFQAKATAQNVLRNQAISFPLSVKNYDDLRADVIVPRLLIIVLLPESESQWLCHSEKELRLRHCGYWLSLLAYTETENTDNITVATPRTQTFNGKQLTQLMDRANRGEPL